MKLSHLAALLALLPLSGCTLLGISRPVDVEHLRISTENGVTYEDIIVGEGAEAELGQDVAIHYVGFLEDGSQFDSSFDRGIAVEFVFGAAPLAGWNEGMAGMRAGGKRLMDLPPELAYGEQGVPGLIPENAQLTFELELLEIMGAQ